jgi:hypothetical protein
MADEPRVPAPVTPPAPPVQARLDRAAMERVLARAAELHASTSEVGDAITEAQLLEIAGEVGLAPQHIRQALAEERARIEISSSSDALTRMFGPAQLQTSRILHGDPGRLLETLDHWMQREESLQVKRRFADRILWEPRRGFFSEVQRSFDFQGKGYHLCRAEEVAASAVPMEGGRALIHLSCDVGSLRKNRLWAGGAATGAGASTTAVLLLLGVFAPVAAGAALIGAGSGYLIARTHGPLAVRVRLAMEQVLDRLERGELPKGGLLGDLKRIVPSIRDQ